jgi:hypothetical protein
MFFFFSSETFATFYDLFSGDSNNFRNSGFWRRFWMLNLGSLAQESLWLPTNFSDPSMPKVADA